MDFKKYLQMVSEAESQQDVVDNMASYGAEDLDEGKFKEMSIVDVNGKNVDVNSLMVDGVHSEDRPDFSDAYISYAEFVDGTPLSDDEMDQLGSEHPDLVNQLAHDSLYESKKPATGKKSLKDWFEQIDKQMIAEFAVPPGMKPLPILDPKNKQAGAGVVTSKNPAVQKMLGGLDPKDVQVVMTTPGAGTTTAPTTGTTQPAQSGLATGGGATAVKEEDVMEKAPPGMEDMVLKLKKQYPGKPELAFATAWKIYNKKHGKNEGAGDSPDSAMLDEKWAGDAEVKATGQYSGKTVEELKSMLAKLKKSGPHEVGSPGNKRMKQIMFAIRAKKGWKGKVEESNSSSEKEMKKQQLMNLRKTSRKKEVEQATKRLHDKLNKPVGEAEIPHAGPDYGAGLGAGRSDTTLESQKVTEAMNTLEAAYHEGKSHGLSKHSYACRYDEGTEEHRRYHDGYKEGLDECYGLMPNQGLVDESGVAESSEWETRHDEFVTAGDRATPEQINKIVSALIIAAKQASGKRGFLNQIVGNQSNSDLARMAHSAETLAKNIQRNSNAKLGTEERKELGQHLVYALSLLKRMRGEQGMEEGNAFTAALAKTPHGGKFSVGGKTFTDTSSYDSTLDEFAFESKQVNELKASTYRSASDQRFQQRDQLRQAGNQDLTKKLDTSASKLKQAADDKEAADKYNKDVKPVNTTLSPAMLRKAGLSATPTGQKSRHDMRRDREAQGGMSSMFSGGMSSGMGMRESVDPAFESLEKQLNALLKEESVNEGTERPYVCIHPRKGKHECTATTSYEAAKKAAQKWGLKSTAGIEAHLADVVHKPVNEGLSVNMSQGLGGPTGQGEDSVSVTATGDDSAKLLDFIKQVGLGGLGNAQEVADGSSEPEVGAVVTMSDYGAPKFSGHEGMKDLMAKITGDDNEEEGEEQEEAGEEETCEGCGMSEGCGCEETTNETETPDQETDEMAEDAAGEEEEQETTADEDAEAKEDETKPAFGGATNESVEKLDEWANEAGKDGTEASFERDIEFMTKVIAGGLNKPKSTGQTTIPVIAGQDSRTGDDDVAAWKKLAGLGK